MYPHWPRNSGTGRPFGLSIHIQELCTVFWQLGSAWHIINILPSVNLFSKQWAVYMATTSIKKNICTLTSCKYSEATHRFLSFTTHQVRFQCFRKMSTDKQPRVLVQLSIFIPNRTFHLDWTKWVHIWYIPPGYLIFVKVRMQNTCMLKVQSRKTSLYSQLNLLIVIWQIYGTHVK